MIGFRGLLALLLLLASATQARSDAQLVTIRRAAMPARPGKDDWRAGSGAAFVYADGKGVVTFGGKGGCLYHGWNFPGRERLRGGGTCVVKTDPAFDGEICLRLHGERKDRGTNITRQVIAPWRKETSFNDGFGTEEIFTISEIGFRAKGEYCTRRFAFLGIDAISQVVPAEAFSVDVETGNELHLVRSGRDEKAKLTFRNCADRKLDALVTYTVEDCFGNVQGDGFALSLDSGASCHHEVPERLPKGIRYVTVVVASEGTYATNRTTWAYIDAHDISPLRHSGFRLGVNFHGLRYLPVDLETCMDGLVAIGAKIARAGLSFGRIWKSDAEFDWQEADLMVAGLARRGIVLDANVWWPAKWAIDAGVDGVTGGAVLRPGVLRAYGEKLARRYGNRIAYYEVGNEWDMTDPTWLPYDAAVRQISELSEGVKSVCPSLKVIPSGFACESSTRHLSGRIRPMFQERLMSDVKDVVDAHPLHMHSPPREFLFQVRHLLQWRRARGIEIPWLANETALSSTAMRPDDRQMADVMWRKVLFAWGHGAVDYLWYNLRATGWNPEDSEQGYGMFTVDFHPRAAAAAFSAMAKTFDGLVFDSIAFDDDNRQIICFRSGGAARARVVAGWDDNANEPMPIRIRTDAAEAFQVDRMGNRTRIDIVHGEAVWRIASHPSALYLRGATVAIPNSQDVVNSARRPLRVIVPSEDFRDIGHSDIVLKDYDQVHELFKADPANADRTWKWWGDLWVWMSVSQRNGKLGFRVSCRDDVHCPTPQDPLLGDCVVLQIGGWRFALVDSDTPLVKVLEKPKGAGFGDGGRWWSLTCRNGYRRSYEFVVDIQALNLAQSIPFNIRVYDNDSQGLECWMEYSPFDEEPLACIRLSQSAMDPR